MSLQPVEGLLATVMKVADVDAQAADTLIHFGVFEAMSDLIEVERPRLERDTAVYLAKRATQAQAAFDARGIAKAQGAGTYRTGLSVIGAYAEDVSKLSLTGALLSLFNRQHPRDDRGRFIRQDIQSSADRLPTQHGQRINQAEQALQKWKQSGLVNDDTQVALHWLGGQIDPATGKFVSSGSAKDNEFISRHKVSEISGKDSQLHDLVSNHTDDAMLNGISFDRASIPGLDSRRRAALDAMAAFTGADGTEMGARLLRALPDADKVPPNAAGDWNRPGSPGDRKAYRRLGMTGSALSAIGAPGSPGHTVGEIARLIGDLGPEAEKVLGPGIRRTAYRYRGTERRPDKALFDDILAADEMGDKLGSDRAGISSATAEKLAEEAGKKGEKLPAVSVANFYANGEGKRLRLNREQVQMAMRGDVAAGYLVRQLPDEELAAISMEAGELPPSQGVIIDHDGELVTQAQGYNGDHYLPFDLKNLGDLGGGQYVRTRAAGGPTTEDIYTGLMAGARQMQVVSNSGVFTVEFDPDLRGGRRYSDKAIRMINRYGKLLEAIEGGRLMENDVPPDVRARLRQNAYEAVGWDAEKGQERFLRALEKERLKLGMNSEDEELEAEAKTELAEWVANQRRAGRSPSNAQRADQLKALMDEKREDFYADKVRRIRLDGKGYAKALLSLKQEFPYYIRSVRYETLPEFLEDRGLSEEGGPRHPSRHGAPVDRGYVSAGQTNPAFARDRQVPVGRQAAAAVPAGGGGGGGNGRPLTGVAQPRRGAEAPSEGETYVPEVENAKVQAPVLAGTKALTEVMASDDVVADLGTAINRTKEALNDISGASFTAEMDGASEHQARGGSDMSYAHYMINSDQFGGDSRKIARWLLREATDQQRAKFVRGFAALPHELEHGQLRDADTQEPLAPETYARTAGTKDAFNKHIATITELGSAASPFAEAATDMEVEPPNEDAPRPQPFPEIVALGDKPANYETYLRQATTQFPALSQAVESMAESEPREIVSRIMGKLRELKRLGNQPNVDEDTLTAKLDEVSADQMAWSFLTARKLAQQLSGEEGEAAPKAPEEGEETAKSLTWLSPTDPASQFVSKALGLWRGKVARAQR